MTGRVGRAAETSRAAARVATLPRVIALFVLIAAAAFAQTPPAKNAPAARKAAAPPTLPTYKELKYPPLGAVATPAVESVTLPDGLQVMLLENHELPLVNGTVMVHAGSAFDPPEKIGLATLTEQVLMEGDTLNRPPGQDVTRRLQDLGVEIQGTVTQSFAMLTFSGLKENTDAMLAAVKDALTVPEFSQDRIDLVKARLRNAIDRRNDDGAALVRRELIATVFGKNSPYGAYMENAHLERINRGDLVDFHQRYFFPRNTMVALAGDFDAAKMKGQLEALFEDWKNDQPPVPDLPQPGNANAAGRFLAVMKGVVHSYFAVGKLSGDYRDKDLAAEEITAGILAGGPASRLNQRLNGTVDNPTAVWTPGLGHPGLFTVSGTISNPFYTTKTLQAVFDELGKLRSQPVSEQELTAARQAAVNGLVFAFADRAAMLPLLAQYRFFQLPDDYLQQHQKALEAVTAADVQRVARQHLDPEQMTAVVAGNPTGFESPLEALGGTVTTIDLAIASPKPEATPGDAISQKRGKLMLARLQEAMGGADKLAGVTDYTEEIHYQFDPSAGGAQTDMTERWMAPGYLRQDNTTPTGKLAVFCDGKSGWISYAQGGSALLAGVQLKQVQSDLFRILFPLVLSDRMPERQVNALDNETVEISDSSGQVAKLVIDPSTGLLKSVLYDAFTVNGMVSVLESYAEFRDVGGLKLPSKIAITLSGKKFQDLTIESMRMNTGLRVEDLSRRP